jgi:hypothetical protein
MKDPGPQNAELDEGWEQRDNPLLTVLLTWVTVRRLFVRAVPMSCCW